MLRIFTLAILWFATTTNLHAVSVGVDFDDADGPHWTGIVDTVADTLTIHTWVENPTEPAVWTPTLDSLPLVWPAVDGTGAPYDVPDTFASTLIDSTFGFLSPSPLNVMTWNEGVFAFDGVRPGWGIGATRFGYELVGGSNISHIPVSEVAAVARPGTVTTFVVPEPSALVCVGLTGLAWAVWMRPRVARYPS